MVHTEENAFLRDYTTSLNKPVYQTLEELTSGLANPYSKEVRVLETDICQAEVVFLGDETKDVRQLKQCFAEVIYNKGYHLVEYVGKDWGLVEDRRGLSRVYNFTILFDKDEFDNYTGFGNSVTDMKNKETSMQKPKPKQKKRLSTKANITYTNGKSYLIKEVVEKVNIHPTFINVCYNEVRKLDGVSLASPRTVANIPTKDILMITILPESNTYMDSKVYFIDGSVEEVLNMVQKGVSYSGNVYFNV